MKLLATTITVGNNAISLSLGLVLVIVAIIMVVAAGRRGSAFWVIASIILGILLASAFPGLATDINSIFT